MKKKSLLSVLIAFFLLTGISFPSFCQNMELNGTWLIDSVTIKKIINGQSSEKMYALSDSIDSFVRCPRKVIIKSDNLIFEYQDGIQEPGTYTIEGNSLKIKSPVAAFDCQYLLDGGDKLQLDYAVNYLIDGINKAEEICKFYGHKEQ